VSRPVRISGVEPSSHLRHIPIRDNGEPLVALEEHAPSCYRVFRKLAAFLECRVARNVERYRPVGKKRRRRSWVEAAQRLREWGKLPPLTQLARGPFRDFGGPVKVRSRAV
jgi:hypothetical protein